MGAAAGDAGIVSHDFYEGQITGLSPDPGWVELDEEGDSTLSFVGAETSSAHCKLQFPSGAHSMEVDPFGGHALVQPVTVNTDFQVEIDVTNAAAGDNEVFGIIVFNPDYSEWVTFDVYQSSTPQMESMVYNGSTFDFRWFGQTGFSSLPYGLRLTYTYSSGGADSWGYDYQSDGGGWTSPHVDETYDLTNGVGHVGFFISNYSTNPASAREFDYLIESGSSLVRGTNEDTFSSLAGGSSRRVMVIS